MKKSAFLLSVALSAAVLWAAEEPNLPVPVRPLKPPKGVALTPEQEKLLAEGNAALASGYVHLMNNHDPLKAVEELRKALAIANQLNALKGEEPQMAGVAPGNEKGTPHDRIEMAGGIERIVEIGAAIGISAPDEVDNGLHKRKIIKEAESEARKIEAEQRNLTQQIQLAVNTGAGGGGDQQPQQQQPGQQQPAGQTGEQGPGPQQPGAQPGQQPTGQPGEQQPGGQPGQQQPGQQPTGQGQALAAREDGIAQGLNKIATDLAKLGTGNEPNRTAQAFRNAAGEAAKTAQTLRSGNLPAAEAASRQTERAIAAALAAAGDAGTTSLEQALQGLENQIAGMQATQQNIQAQTEQIGRGANGGQAPETVQRERGIALAGEQAKLKPQIEGLQETLGSLAASAGNPANPAARTPENAARAELGAAATGLQNNRAKQEAVNAAIGLAQGEPARAAKSMAQVQTALNEARERVAAAEGALATGDNTRLQAALRSIRDIAGSLRRLEKTAQAAAGNAQEGQRGAQAPEAGAANQVSPSWGQLLNKSASQINADLARAAQRLERVAPDLSKEQYVKQVTELAGKAPAFERDFRLSLTQTKRLLVAVGKLEVELARKVGSEAEKKALRDYRKDDIPSTYRKAVAEYYEDLSKQGE